MYKSRLRAGRARAMTGELSSASGEKRQEHGSIMLRGGMYLHPPSGNGPGAYLLFHSSGDSSVAGMKRTKGTTRAAGPEKSGMGPFRGKKVSGPAGSGHDPPSASASSLRASVRMLMGGDIRTSVRAASCLIKSGGRCVPLIIRFLGQGNPGGPASGSAMLEKRALFVLHNIEWRAAPPEMKEKAIERLCFLLFRFDGCGKRTPESLLAESILQRMGPEALPLFAALLRSPKPVARLLGLSALLDIEWSERPRRNVHLVESALGEMGRDRILVFRDAAKIILRRIRVTFMAGCNGREGDGRDGPGQAERGRDEDDGDGAGEHESGASIRCSGVGPYEAA